MMVFTGMVVCRILSEVLDLESQKKKTPGIKILTRF